MSPRGVAIPDLRRRLFEAADAVLERDGPQGLTSRAITTEAGTSAGLLFRHFADFEGFLAEFVVDRLEHVHKVTAAWRNLAGSNTVAGNLTAAALSLLPLAAHLFEVIHGRPSLISRLMTHGHAHLSAGLEEIERSFAEYLDAEVALGRVRADADTGAVALALAASVHELALRLPPDGQAIEERVRRVAGALAGQITVSGAAP